MKHNYLNNKDILKEIHKSKNTYCWFAAPTDTDYDLIITDGRKITKKDLTEAKKNRAERLSKLAHEAAVLEQGKKLKADEFAIKHTKIPDTDVVIRVMTWDHIPIDTTVKAKKTRSKVVEPIEEDEPIASEYDLPEEPAKPTKYMKVNFPPFKHMRLVRDEATETEEWQVVALSHWQGSLSNGKFCRDHGGMTNKLAHMFMKLCERYATRSNWRGYTYNDEMRSQALLQLAQIGLQFDESKSQNPFAYYTAAITNSFTRVLNIEKRNQNLRDDILQMNNLNPSYTRQLANSMNHQAAVVTVTTPEAPSES
jgi:hypothetical protein